VKAMVIVRRICVVQFSVIHLVHSAIDKRPVSRLLSGYHMTQTEPRLEEPWAVSASDMQSLNQRRMPAN
jgi:hypothetical protein